MLKDKDSSAIVAVADLDRAKVFYQDVLELELTQENEQVLEFQTGTTSLIVYLSDFAGSNKANAVVWGVGSEIEAITERLRGKGVTFEQYEGMNYDNGIHRDGEYAMVWFKDPDGNILHLNNM